MVFLGSRANYSSLKSVMKYINDSEKIELFLVVGASAILDKYGEVINLVEKDGFQVNEKLYMIIEGETPETMAKSTGLGLIELSGILMKYRPDFTLLVGDRFEMLSAAIASAYNNIPIVHTMGGEVSGSIDESIRHAITKLAHVHFPANELARERILQMGENEDCVFNFGCPRIDTVKEILNNPFQIEEMNKYISLIGVGDVFKIDNKFLLLSQHPVTTEYGEGKNQISETLKAVREISIERDVPVLVLWPNSDAGSDDVASGIRIFREKYNDRNFHFFKNIPLESYIWLMEKTLCLVGNSSSGIREGAFIGTPVVNIGTRQDDRARGKNVIDTDYKYKEIKNAIETQIKHGKYISEHIYGEGNAGKQIVDVLEDIDVKIQKKFVKRNFINKM
ncbi:UDP-N,N'-diacetylbacillosamine 2-epimerase (hydrolyzing) [subsurface metagenome]